MPTRQYFSPKKIGKILAIFIAGAVCAIIISFILENKFKSYTTVLENQTTSQNEIMVPYSILQKLRKNKIESAINLLELQLDTGLFDMAYKIDKTNFKIDSTTQQILDKIREYREKYPREYKNDDYKQKIKSLLDR